MSKLSGGASYLTKESVPAKRVSTQKKSPVMVAVSAFFALLVLFMSAQPLLASLSGTSSNKANAGAIGLFCTSDLGLGMDDKSDWSQFLRVYPLPNEKNRVWTLQEAFGSGLAFTNYEGEGGKDKDLIIEKSPENTTKPGNYDAVAEKLEGIRGIPSCFTAGGLNYVSNAAMGLANVQSNIVQAFVVFAFDSNIICADPANPSGVCLNLLKVIGGTGGTDGGLIGILTSSIYMPLLVIAVTITGFWVGYKGIVQRKLREAMFGAIWVCLSVIFGLALLLNPTLLAKAPMAVSNAVATCVIGSFSGQNCMDNSTGSGSLVNDSFSTSSDTICRSIAPGASLDSQMSMTVNSLSCSIWKAFVLEPYAQGSFGTSFGNLDTIADTPTKKVIEKAGLDPNTFCVNLGSSDSLASFSGKRAVFDRESGKVCNLLAYQMFLKTNASTTGSVTPAADSIDPRWYNVIVTAANDEGLWAQWAPSSTNAMHKISTGILAGFTGLVGGVVLVAIAFFALVYYLTSVILMAFAPLFFLMGVHPGRGKKILMGWLEKVVSNVLKYLASALFLIVSIAFYAAILGAATSPALTFLFVIIMSGALFMYRKEVIDLVGKVSMGGEQLSNSFSDKLKERAAGVGGLAMAGVGSGVGAAIAGGRVSSGIKAGIQRDLQRGGANKIFGKTGGDLVSNATRQFARNTVDNERDVKDEAKRAQAQAGVAAVELATIEDEQVEAGAAIEKFDLAFYNNQNELSDLESRRASYSGMETEAAREMMEDNPYFAQAQLLMNQISALEFDKGVALAIGDNETADLKTAEIQQLTGQRETLLGAIDTDELASNRKEYSERLEDKIFRSNINYTDEDEKARHGLTALTANAQSTRDVLVETANELTERRNEYAVSTASLTAKEEFLNEKAMNLQPGDMLNKKTADKMIADADALALTAGASVGRIAPTAINRSMEEVYSEQHAKFYVPNELPSDGPRGPIDGDGRGPIDGGSGPQGPIDGGSGPLNPGPTRGSGPSPQGPADSDALTPTATAGPTRQLPTSPQNAESPTAPPAADRPSTSSEPTSPLESSGPTDRIPVQSDRSPSALQRRMSELNNPTESIPETSGRSSESLPAAAPVVDAPRQSGGIPTSQGRQPAPVLSDTAPAYESSQPAVQPNYAPRIPTQPANAPSVSAQPNREPQQYIPESVPQRTESAPSSLRQESAPSRMESRQEYSPIPTVAPQPRASEPAPRPAPAYEPRIPSQPVNAPSTPVQPTASPQIPSQPTSPPRVEAQQQSTPAPVVAPPAPVRAPTPQPESAPRIPAQPATPPVSRTPDATPRSAPQQAPSAPPQEQRIPAQPATAPVQTPSAQRLAPQQAPVQAPSAPVREPRVPTQPNRAPEVSQAAPVQTAAPSAGRTSEQAPRPAPQQAPSAPAREPRIPTQPNRTPEAPAPQPVAPVRPPTSATPISRPPTPTAAIPSAPAPAIPTRTPVVPAQPSAPPAQAPTPPPAAAPTVRNREERGVPLAREIRLPSAPQVSRITENSEIPTVSIQRENPIDNEAPTRGRGLPRRRNPRND